MKIINDGIVLVNPNVIEDQRVGVIIQDTLVYEILLKLQEGLTIDEISEEYKSLNVMPSLIKHKIDFIEKNFLLKEKHKYIVWDKNRLLMSLKIISVFFLISIIPLIVLTLLKDFYFLNLYFMILTTILIHELGHVITYFLILKKAMVLYMFLQEI